MKPTFIGIGAQKCASTWLHRILEEHPAIGVGVDKEIDFFSYHFDHGYQWYEKQFVNCEHKSVIGEISPSYLCEPAVPERVQQYLPDAKILVSFRDPVQRALSNHRHEVRVGHFTGAELTFEAGLSNNPMYVEQGRYATHLKRWLQYFPSEQILVVLMEDVEKDPLSVARNVYAFLGVDSSYQPQQLTKRFNQSYANRSRVLLSMKDILYKLTRSPGFGWLWSLGSMLGIKALYRGVNTVRSNMVIPEPAKHSLDELRLQFAPEIRELSALIQRPLDGWLK